MNIINLESDSGEVVEIKPKPKRFSTQISSQFKQMKATKKSIAFQFEGSLEKCLIDAKTKDFSQLLNQMDEEPNIQDQNIILTINVLSSFGQCIDLIKLIELFYQKHNFKEETINITKITIEGYKKSIDPVTLKYIQDYISKLSEEKLRNLFRLSEYFKFNHFKQLISVFIASQNFYGFNDREIQRKKMELGAFYSREEDINIHKKLRPFCQQLGMELLQKLKEKYDSRHRPQK